MTAEQTAAISRVKRLMRDRVERGARLLDEKRPGWENEIDIEHFDISDANTCILGQVFMNGSEHDPYNQGIKVLFPDSEYGNDDKTHGFDLDAAYYQGAGINREGLWELLAVYWIRQIQRRKGN